MHMGYPSYVLETDDHPAEEHWLSLPENLRQELDHYIAADQAPPAGQLDGPCFWFDQETRSCKHYDYRPRVCRDFAVGCTDCLGWRKWLSEEGTPGFISAKTPG